MPALDGGDDFVGIGGPGEGLWLLVVLGEEAVDGGLEVAAAFLAFMVRLLIVSTPPATTKTLDPA